MKKYFFIVIALFVCLTLTNCESGSQFDRKIRKEVKNYLKETLKDPDSVKDLVITYAPLSSEEQREGWDKAIEKFKEERTGDYPVLYFEAFHGGKNNAVILLEYRAKNSYGAYIKGLDALKYWENVGDGSATIESIKKGEMYLFSLMLRSPNKVEMK